MTDVSFQTLKSVAAIEASEPTGMFQAIGSGSNSYEVDAGILVVTPPVSPNGVREAGWPRCFPVGGRGTPGLLLGEKEQR